MKMYYDNQVALHIDSNPISMRTKSIEIDNHFIRENSNPICCPRKSTLSLWGQMIN